MKRIIITFALLAIVASAAAQNPVKGYTRKGDTFVQSNPEATPFKGDQVTAYKWRDSKGNEYPIILHTYVRGEKVGRITAYVIRKSAKTGKDYKYYLPDGEKIAEDIIKESR